ncbi:MULTISPECIES: aminoglycoside 6-adenylyltransferase [unclassified Crossiella]|uniref:aminoglycoside 6-adenylyltransferase n=1 Tax=unclassified Crossiella TaxID=2620835 RepID=UPI001FFFAD18|nr:MULTISPECIES: aminoglycoside 6-adenylyltransferase [unclassified Crossiella]MCK2241427.1 aminoglycoside 6-adenylyltransferase [Crossiella sp. S99.2]MCK2255701.1 aminoglycoside 6-adenylyltransferase [Crossiella sp. S99.1]
MITEAGLAGWAAGRADIRLVLRTGSRARRDGTADAFSDHDIELFSTDPDFYAEDADWPAELGPVLVSVGLDGPWDNPARLVLFTDGVKADFQVVPLSLLDELAGELDELHERGYEVLYDPDGLAARLPAPTGRPRPEPVTEPDFQELCAEFWFEIAHLPRYLARGELWVAKSRDWTTKELLQTLVEWHAQAVRGADLDVWHGGTRMRDWAAPGVWDRLPSTFGEFDAADARRAAHATGVLFAELAREVAKAHDFTYDPAPETAILPQLTP